MNRETSILFDIQEHSHQLQKLFTEVLKLNIKDEDQLDLILQEIAHIKYMTVTLSLVKSLQSTKK